MDLKQSLSFGFEQTFTIPNWWTDEGFVSTSDTALKREKIKLLADELAKELDGSVIETKDIYDHIQYEVQKEEKTLYWVTLDPGSIEVKTIPLYFDELKNYFEPLFLCAQRSGLVPYRNWWYGVKSGTEGGTHINMGGKDLKTNPFYQNPALLLKYIIWVHNHPCMHYPFMGPDVGPEGNAMRIDEQKEFDSEQTIEILSSLNKTQNFSLNDLLKKLEETSLVKEKCSMPSLFKFEEPLYLIEDRGQEAFRDTHDVLLVTKMRLKIFQYLLQNEVSIQKASLSLHQENLTSYSLWKDFQKMASEIGLEANLYRHFFDRQFPILNQGKKPSNVIELREGRRPRVITDRKFRDGICIAKTIDTRHKRFEFFALNDVVIHFKENKIQLLKGERSYLDLFLEKNEDLIEIQSADEKTFFSVKNMMWE